MKECMKITGVFHIKGRGTVVVVEDLTPGVKIGCLIHQGELAWKITGAETPSRTQLVGLVLKPDGHDKDPEVGEINL